MLILSRKIGDAIVIGGIDGQPAIKILVSSIHGSHNRRQDGEGKVRLKIEAPASVKVRRGETVAAAAEAAKSPESATTIFICPRCGSEYFGRDTAIDPADPAGKRIITLPTVRCHGDSSAGSRQCGWRGVWPAVENEAQNETRKESAQ